MEKYRGEGYQPKKALTSEPPHQGSKLEPRGTKQVRTAVRIMEGPRDAEHFDDEVNEAIRDGWKLRTSSKATAIATPTARMGASFSKAYLAVL